MTLKERQIASLKRKISYTKDLIDKYSGKLKGFQEQLELAEMEELKSVLTQNGMSVEDIIKKISLETNGVIKEKKPEGKETMEEKEKCGIAEKSLPQLHQQ